MLHYNRRLFSINSDEIVKLTTQSSYRSAFRRVGTRMYRIPVFEIRPEPDSLILVSDALYIPQSINQSINQNTFVKRHKSRANRRRVSDK